jgi:serine/threonine-protein kinase
MPLTDGEVFAGYTIKRLLGSGGMGEVYLAQHPRLPRLDALKILSPTPSADDDFRRRFSREADLATTLWHPHIVGVHDRGDFDEQIWISMDYVDGSDAGRLLREKHPSGLPPADVIRIVTAIADALDFAHERRLFHRDVKPANILLTTPKGGRRRILLTDFGIACQADDISGLTATNATVGSVGYAAPEQLQGEPLDGRADQYSLAATAVHLFTGMPPFPYTNPAVVISKHLTAAPPKLASRRRDLACFDPVISIALAKEPARRYATCQDFARALDEHNKTRSMNPTLLISTQVPPRVPRAEIPAAEASRARVPRAEAPAAEASRARVLRAEAPRAAARRAQAPPAESPCAAVDPPTERVRPTRDRPGRKPAKLILAVVLLIACVAGAVAIYRVFIADASSTHGPTTLPPNDQGHVAIASTSGDTVCVVSEENVTCEADFTCSPTQQGGCANEVSLTSRGRLEWKVGDIGKPRGMVKLDARTYHVLGWTVVPGDGGTRFTNDATGRGMFVSPSNVHTI